MLEVGGNCRSNISIALATYNGAHHLQQQLESLALQTLLPVELIVTDDGSTDETIAILRNFALSAPFPVRIYQNEKKLGFADNFLFAASLCRGDLIAFCDQDDFWQPTKLARCAPSFDDPLVLMCAHSADVWDGLRTSGELYPNFAETRTYASGTINPFLIMPGFAMIVRSSLLRLVPSTTRPRDVRVPRQMAHDQWAWLLASLSGSVATIADSLVLYRQHSKNTVGVPKQGKLYSLILALQQFHYGDLAQTEEDCAELSIALSEGHSSRIMKHNATASGKRMLLRASFHRGRHLIYNSGTTFAARLDAYRSILSAKGYTADSAGYRLGRMAAVKDLLIGVLGLNRLISTKAY